ncbi:MAG: (Fe-S)-binding protein [Planctomycetota bacterium]
MEEKIIDFKKALAKLDALLDGKMSVYMNACVHCGLCADTCHYSLANPDDPAMLPAAKIEQITSIYRRYHTLLGRMIPKWTGARELDQERVEKLIDAVFGRCTMCGRCGLNCSIGLHAGQIIRAARTILAEVGLVPKSLQSTVDTAVRTGNNMAISEKDFVETIEWLQDDLRLETGVKAITIPLDKSGVNILYTLNPREPKFFPLSITAAAKVFYAAGENWTLSRKNFDVTNYAIFSGNDAEAREISSRLIKEAKNLGANKLALAECGHGFRSTRWELANWSNQKLGVDVQSVLEIFAAYIKEGRLKLDPSKNSKRVTLHDPCNLVRNGGVIEEQRYILKHAVQDFVEMIPNRKQNFCCGGGGGMLAMGEYKERRIKAGKIKADQIRATGAKVVATPCHNCIDQLMELNDHYKLGVEIKTVSEILAEAVILNKP